MATNFINKDTLLTPTVNWTGMMDYKLLNFIYCICQIAPYIISRADCNSLMGKSLIFQGQE